MNVGKETVQFGKELNDFSIIADGEIVEITADNGLVYAVFEMESDSKSVNVTVDIGGKAMSIFTGWNDNKIKTGAYQSEDLFMLAAPFLFWIDCLILLRNSVISF